MIAIEYRRRLIADYYNLFFLPKKNKVFLDPEKQQLFSVKRKCLNQKKVSWFEHSLEKKDRRVNSNEKKIK